MIRCHKVINRRKSPQAMPKVHTGGGSDSQMTTAGAQARKLLREDIRTLEDLCLSNAKLVLYMKCMPNREYVIQNFILCLME